MKVILVATISGLLHVMQAIDDDIEIRDHHENVNIRDIDDDFLLPNCPEIYDIYSDEIDYIHPLPHNTKEVRQYDLVTNPRSNKHLTIMKRVTD